VASQIPPRTSAAEALERLGRLSLRQLSMDSLLRTLADVAKAVMPGDIEASVTMLVKDAPRTAAATGQLAVDLDESQYRHGYGPCLHAARTAEVIEIVDTRTEPRWHEYVLQAAGHGNLSSLSVPLAIDEEEQVTGALNLYAREAGAFDADSRAVAQSFGPYAAVAAGNLYSYQNARALADNLQVALESRAIIDQAKGVLIERHRLTAEQAFQVLAQASMTANHKLRDIAEHLVITGELLAPPARATGREPGRGGRRPRPSPGVRHHP
jgi:GAF domain-containing protein